MYVTPAKREYGYYVLPILHGTEFVGRVDPVLDRKTGVLRVNGVWAERGAPDDAGAPIRAAMDELARWVGATSVQLPSRLPRAWARALRSG